MIIPTEQSLDIWPFTWDQIEFRDLFQLENLFQDFSEFIGPLKD